MIAVIGHYLYGYRAYNFFTLHSGQIKIAAIVQIGAAVGMRRAVIRIIRIIRIITAVIKIADIRECDGQVILSVIFLGIGRDILEEGGTVTGFPLAEGAALMLIGVKLGIDIELIFIAGKLPCDSFCIFNGFLHGDHGLERTLLGQGYHILAVFGGVLKGRDRFRRLHI